MRNSPLKAFASPLKNITVTTEGSRHRQRSLKMTAAANASDAKNFDPGSKGVKKKKDM